MEIMNILFSQQDMVILEPHENNLLYSICMMLED